MASIALMLTFASCSDSDDNDNQGGGSGQDQILVMFYGVGGGNLDGSILGNVLQSLNAGSSDKVKITYQYRFSKDYQSKESADYHNILRFTADENKQFVGKVDIESTLKEKYCFKTFEGQLNAKHIGDANFVMASDTALTSFIKWSEAQYPSAKKTILIISDHGGGWDMARDGKVDYNNGTRAILYDDNTIVNNTSLSLSLGDVKRALSNAGKVDMLYTDACLMSTWENLTGFADVATFFLGSLETAPGIGGNYNFLINRLKNTEVTDDGLYSAGIKYIDDVINNWWEKVNETEPGSIYGDLAVYDLRKINEPLTVLSDIRKTLVEKYNDTTTIPGLTDTLMGTTWKEYINAAISGCEVATTYFGGYVPASKMPQEFVDTLEANRSFYESILGNAFSNEKNGEIRYFGPIVVDMLKSVDFSTLNYETDLYIYLTLWEYLAQGTVDSYPVSDLLDMLNYFLNIAGSTDKTFSDLNDRYYNALKDFGYVNCTMPITSTTYPCPYQLCSPGVTIFPFNAEGFSQQSNFSARYNKSVTVDEAVKYYQATDFDKKVQWCEFLKTIDRAPDLVSNPSRGEIK